MHKNIIPSFDLYKTLDNTLGFELTNLEESYSPYDATLPHRHSYYEILIFKGSGGIHEIDFTAFPIVENSMHFISPDQVHLLRHEKHVTGYVLSFTKDFFLEEKSRQTYIDTIPFLNNPYASPVAYRFLMMKIFFNHFFKTVSKFRLSRKSISWNWFVNPFGYNQEEW